MKLKDIIAMFIDINLQLRIKRMSGNLVVIRECDNVITEL